MNLSCAKRVSRLLANTLRRLVADDVPEHGLVLGELVEVVAELIPDPQIP